MAPTYAQALTAGPTSRAPFAGDFVGEIEMVSDAPEPSSPLPPVRVPKRKRVEKSNEGEEDAVTASVVRTPAARISHKTIPPVKDQLLKHFGVDEGWAGNQICREMDDAMKRGLESVCLVWLTMACSYEHAAHFGPTPGYDPRSIVGVSNFVIEQFGVRPDFCRRYPSPGRTSKFILLCGSEAATRLLDIPRGWIKLAHGLGCRITVPPMEPSTTIPIHITGVLPIISDSWLLSKITDVPGIRAVKGGFERVRLENNVMTDRVACLLELDTREELPFDPYGEKFDYLLKVGGMTLKVERRTACLVCGEDTHLQFACPTKQRLTSDEMAAWSFVAGPNKKSEGKAGDGGPKAKKQKVSSAEKVADDKKTPALEKKKKNKSGKRDGSKKAEAKA